MYGCVHKDSTALEFDVQPSLGSTLDQANYNKFSWGKAITRSMKLLFCVFSILQQA